MVGEMSPLMKLQSDPPVAIAAFMFFTYGPDLRPFLNMVFWVCSVFLVIVIRASGELRYDQKLCQGVN